MRTRCADTLRRDALSLVVLLAVVMVSGCVVGPDFKRPLIKVPAAWSEVPPADLSSKQAIAGWWRRLNDRQLNQLVTEAIAANTDVRQAKARVRQARALVWQTGGTLLPSVNGTSDVAHSRASGGAEQTLYRQGFDASWELDLFGANRRAVEAAHYGLDASQEDLRATLVTLLGDLASNYVTMRGLQQRLSLAKRTAIAQRSTAALTQQKYIAGAVSSLDAANSEGQASSTEATVPQLEANLAVTVHRLAVLTGHTPAELNDRFLKTEKIPQPAWPLPITIPADILTQRPDIRVAEYRYAQATAKVGQAKAAKYPAITLTGNIATAANNLGDLSKNSTISWSFGPSLSIPIFNGGQRRAEVALAQAERDQTFVAYEASVLQGLEEVENALVNLRRERERYLKLRQASQSYARALTLSRQLYRVGNTSFLELLTAERSSYNADSSLIDSQVKLTESYIALMKALGGGFDGTLDSSAQEVIDRNTAPHMANTGSN